MQLRRSEAMMIPRLTQKEYSDIIEDWNRRCRRGTVEPCQSHEWARKPMDSEYKPKLICIHCLREAEPRIVDDPRISEPMRGTGRPL